MNDKHIDYGFYRDGENLFEIVGGLSEKEYCSAELNVWVGNGTYFFLEL